MNGLADKISIVAATISKIQRKVATDSIASLSLSPPVVLVYIGSSIPVTRSVSQTKHFNVGILSNSKTALTRRFTAPDSSGFQTISISRIRNLPLLHNTLTQLIYRIRRRISKKARVIFLNHIVRTRTGPRNRPLTCFQKGFNHFRFTAGSRTCQITQRHVLTHSCPPSSAVSLIRLTATLNISRTTTFCTLAQLSSSKLIHHSIRHKCIIIPVSTRLDSRMFSTQSYVRTNIVRLILSAISSNRLRSLTHRLDIVTRYVRNSRFISFRQCLRTGCRFRLKLIQLTHGRALRNTFNNLDVGTIVTQDFKTAAGASRSFLVIRHSVLSNLHQQGITSTASTICQCDRLTGIQIHRILTRTNNTL